MGDDHPHFAQYKNVGKIRESQNRRRNEALERQKESRFDFVSKLRKIAIGEELSDDEAEEVEHVEGEFDEEYKPKKKAYANRLMLSEWLVDIPEEDRLSGDWLMVPSPKGRRCLLVASGGITSAYTKSGFGFAQFTSLLPGGSDRNTGSCTILDGVIDKKQKAFYALDLLMWNNNPLDSSDFACRHFMLESRIFEEPNFAKRSADQSYRIFALPVCKCTRDEMENMLEQRMDYYLDGLLFYHSQVLYAPGQSPLVGWLKPWMMPEILNVSVPEKFKTNPGDNNTHVYIQKYNANHNHKSMVHAEEEM